jgi:uncharacterized protein involved in exopolysaccharide biosynthesis
MEAKIKGEAGANHSETTRQTGAANSVTETPQIQQLRAQLHQIDVTVRQKSDEQSKIQKDIGRLRERLQMSPAVEQEYKSLTRDYQTALGIYNDLLKKQNDSEMATDLERRQQGEQFRVLDPPSLPQKPTFPNRPLFALGGLAGGLAIGLGIAFLMEAQDTTLRTERDVELLLRLPTLALIPTIKSNGNDGSHKMDLERPAEALFSSIGSN